ncbi:MAG: sensor histidine kinase [Pseudobdellovibrionaceae bacterium]
MLRAFLKEHREEIIELASHEAVSLAGVRPTSDQLKLGFLIFFQQLQSSIGGGDDSLSQLTPELNHSASVKTGAESAGQLGIEMFRLGYTLSHVVHVYGSLCQAVTGLAIKKGIDISSLEFRDLNRCLDVALAGAVSSFEKLRDSNRIESEVKRCGFCAHELRNSLGVAMLSLEMIKSGQVGFAGSVGQAMERSLKRMEELIGRSLTEVKLVGAAPNIEIQSINLLLLVDQLLVTANVEAKKKKQSIDVQIDPNLTVDADLQFFHSAISNLIQNALKYSHHGGRIQIRAQSVDQNVVIEIEDECGGLAANAEQDLFNPFEQQNKNRSGLGLGLTLTRKAIELHHGKISARSLAGIGCVFKIVLPAKSQLV